MGPSKCTHISVYIEMLFVHFAVCPIVYSVPLRMLETGRTGQKRAVKDPGQATLEKI
jgi:hypothetical protein